MKVIDPQSALLTTVEVHQFLKDNPIREKDKKVGAYATVNVVNNHLVRRDVEHYIQLVHPHIIASPPVDDYMRDLLQKLKVYELTKTEVLTLINLGVGTAQDVTTPGVNGDAQEATNGDTTADGEDEEVSESDLGRSLFRLVVEESDERFSGEDGERKIDDILAVVRSALQGKGKQTITNGHA